MHPIYIFECFFFPNLFAPTYLYTIHTYLHVQMHLCIRPQFAMSTLTGVSATKFVVLNTFGITKNRSNAK